MALTLIAPLALIVALTLTLILTLIVVVAVRPPEAAAAVRTRAVVIPSPYLNWYKTAAWTCPGLAWEVLAAIGTIESDNGQSNARGVHRGKNRKGAEGPMQFEPATFAEYAVQADRSARLSPYDPQDAIFSAARMLCADGAASGSASGMRGAILAYNHAHWYVRDVLGLAAGYTAMAASSHPATVPPRAKRRHKKPGWVHGYSGAGRRAPVKGELAG